MNSLKLACILGVLALASGCSGSSASSDDEPPAEGALAKGGAGDELEPKAAAIEIHTVPMIDHSVKDETIVVGADTKLKSLAKAFKILSPEDPIPKCMPQYRHDLRYLDESGKELSKLSVSCAGYGTFTKGGKTEHIKAVNDNLESVAKMALVPGDALWGISQVKVTRFGQGDKTVKEDAAVEKLVAAIDGDQKIDTEAPEAKCMPDYAIHFLRGTKEVASASFICGADTRKASTGGRFTIPGAKESDEAVIRGAIKIDPRPFTALFE
ncbi:MAG: hypothetical protein U0235_13560 [Polyangiaceae bacterium]